MSFTPTDVFHPPRELECWLVDDGEYAVFVFPLPEAPRDAAPALTEAEQEVAKLASIGLSNAEIAQRRKVSLRTVANQLRSVYHKLGVSSRIELTQEMSRQIPRHAEPTGR